MTGNAKLGALAAALAFFAGALCAGQEQRKFTQTTGSRVSAFEYRLTETEGGYLETMAEGAVGLDRGMNTVEWEYRRPEEGTSLEGKASEGKILLKGTFKGKPVSRAVDMRGGVWAQDQFLRLEAFARSGEERVSFWSVKADDLKAYEFEARRLGIEEIERRGGKVRAIRVRLRLSGALAVYWSADFWFDPASGRFLHYESRHGGPLSPITTIERAD